MNDKQLYVLIGAAVFAGAAVLSTFGGHTDAPPPTKAAAPYDPARDPIAQRILRERRLREAVESANGPSFWQRYSEGMIDSGQKYCRDNANEYYSYDKCRRDWDRPFK